MSIKFMENFSLYGVPADMLTGTWTQIGRTVTGGSSGALISDPDPTATGTVWGMQYDGSPGDVCVLRYALQSASQTVVGTAFRLWIASLPTGTNQAQMITTWRDATNTIIGGIGVDNTGRLYITTTEDGDQTTALASTTTPVIGTDAWYHIECKMSYGGSGNVSVRVEGATVLNYNGSFTTGNGPIYQVAWRLHNTGDYNLKDIVIWDGEGSLNNDFIGPCIVYSMTPASDVALNWTPVGGANGWTILENAPYNNSEYIEAPSSLPSPYKASLTALPSTVTTVKGAMTIVRAAKSDAGTGDLQVSMVSGSSTANGSNRPITTAETYWYDIQELDPATSSAWTRTGIDAANLELNRTA